MSFGDFPIPIQNTIAFGFALAYGVTVAAVLLLFYFLGRRKRGRPPAVEAERDEAR